MVVFQSSGPWSTGRQVLVHPRCALASAFLVPFLISLVLLGEPVPARTSWPPHSRDYKWLAASFERFFQMRHTKPRVRALYPEMIVLKGRLNHCPMFGLRYLPKQSHGPMSVN